MDETETIRPLPAKGISRLSLGLALCLLLVFGLPWVNVSCDSTQTEDLTGFELALRKDPEFVRGSEGRKEVLALVHAMNAVAAPLLLVSVCAAALALATAIGGQPWTARLLNVAAVLIAHGFVAFWLSSQGFIFNDAEAHHMLGFGLGFTIAALLCMTSAMVSFQTRPQGHRHHPSGPRRALITSLALLFLMVMTVIVMVSFGLSTDARLTVAAVGFISVFVLAVATWAASAWLTLAEPSLAAFLSLLLAGIPIVLISPFILAA